MVNVSRRVFVKRRDTTRWWLTGHAGCQSKYGACVYDGKGVEKDLSEAARYLKMAAERRMALLDRSKTLVSL